MHLTIMFLILAVASITLMMWVTRATKIKKRTMPWNRYMDSIAPGEPPYTIRTEGELFSVSSRICEEFPDIENYSFGGGNNLPRMILNTENESDYRMYLKEWHEKITAGLVAKSLEKE